LERFPLGFTTWNRGFSWIRLKARLRNTVNQIGKCYSASTRKAQSIGNMATKKKLIFQRPIGLPEPYYEQALGAAYLGDSLDLMRELGPQSVNLILR